MSESNYRLQKLSNLLVRILNFLIKNYVYYLQFCQLGINDFIKSMNFYKYNQTPFYNIYFNVVYKYIGDEESGDDDEILSRESLKKQAQQIVDAKTKRRPGKKKKSK